MKVAALVSGGKDSILAMLMAQSAGHDVVALGHLKPPTECSDSYMFQSAGSAIVVAHFADLFGLPLLVQESEHKTLVQTKDYYQGHAGDEVEDLRNLLLRLKVEHGIEGVTTGAVFSDYQRLRVESLCLSLGLLSIAPLWQLEQSTILDLVAQWGLEVVLCKVCSAGLDGGDLNKPLDPAMKAKFEALNREHGFHVAGEGGEYESLVLGAKHLTHSIKIIESSVVSPSTDQYLLHIEKCELTENLANPLSAFVLDDVALFEQDDHDFIEVEKQLPTFAFPACFADEPVESATTEEHYVRCIGVIDVIEGSWNTAFISTFNKFEQLLTSCRVEKQSICYVEVQLNDLAEFSGFNKEYLKFFGQQPPPSRACTETNLGSSMIRITVYAGNKGSVEHLHVQSLSQWATPCIGPYSQVITSPAQNTTEGPKMCAFSGTICLNSMALNRLQLPHYYRSTNPRYRRLFDEGVCTLGRDLTVEIIMIMRSILRVCLEVGTTIDKLSGATVAISKAALNSVPDLNTSLLAISSSISRLITEFIHMYADIAPPSEKGGKKKLRKTYQSDGICIVNTVVFPALPKDVLAEIMPAFLSTDPMNCVMVDVKPNRSSFLKTVKISQCEEEKSNFYCFAEAQSVVDGHALKRTLIELQKATDAQNRSHLMATVYTEKGCTINEDTISLLMQEVLQVPYTSIFPITAILPFSDGAKSSNAMHIVLKTIQL